MPKIINVGIDISLRKAAVSIIDQSGVRLGKPFEIPNTLPGAQDLEERLLAILKAGGFESLRLGMESTSFYGFHLAEYFTARTKLAPWRTLVYMVNAKRIHDFKGAFPERDKTDLVDAEVIAEFLRFGRLPEPYEGQAPYLPLKRLVRYRYHVVRTIQRETQYFIANLFLKFPGWVQNKPMSTLLGASARAVLTEFTPDELTQMPLEELAAFIAKAGKNRSPDPQTIAKAVQQAARESHRIRPELGKSVQLILASIIRNIQALRATLKEIDAAVADAGKGFLNPLLSVPGIGPVYASGILASIGNIRRFQSDEALAKMAGLVWPRKQSGEFEAENRRLIRSADRYLRYYLVEAANSLRVHNEEYREYYRKKYPEVKTHKHKRALVLTARKLVRLVFALLSQNQLYDPARRFQSATAG
ncbi:MAG: IS110 family transposase [Deltaproteobacteria bacterium]|nr:IS110 family transposase [Deltaproteobacteria bacterium]